MLSTASGYISSFQDTFSAIFSLSSTLTQNEVEKVGRISQAKISAYEAESERIKEISQEKTDAELELDVFLEEEEQRKFQERFGMREADFYDQTDKEQQKFIQSLDISRQKELLQSKAEKKP